ncbi:hypothetical protein PSU4_37650 [Pseudonocardia sulfidoxydans NBRC 16205]|uniref:Uncharacterized protein n=1 Tax=Pseudonocardia sulfidoxydans NBRC 16205 TaxID=1223511 RepID=A0A511DJ25_9PSEU|nr:hypothetical protein PSU4_37650 [Pseudonocardia sulfidoxydans NBRC 16205]
MSELAQKRRSWSRYSERRIPTEYEFVSHDLHWHYKPGQTPWEMSPDHVWNRWYVEHRNDSPSGARTGTRSATRTCSSTAPTCGRRTRRRPTSTA